MNDAVPGILAVTCEYVILSSYCAPKFLLSSTDLISNAGTVPCTSPTHSNQSTGHVPGCTTATNLYSITSSVRCALLVPAFLALSHVYLLGAYFHLAINTEHVLHSPCSGPASLTPFELP